MYDHLFKQFLPNVDLGARNLVFHETSEQAQAEIDSYSIDVAEMNVIK